MSTAAAQRFLLTRALAGSTPLLGIVLDLGGTVPAWCDGMVGDGRTFVLVGRHQLGHTVAARDLVAEVVATLGAGLVPEGLVHVVEYGPRASEAIAAVVAGDATEVLIDGPRGSGKTQAVPAALAILAELHARAGFMLPLRALWLHDTLTNAAVKTARSLEASLWGALWRIQDDRRVAVLSVAGVDLVVADFVGARDETSAERLRAECHVLAAEELVPSLDDSGGIEERKYELALTSRRLPTRRRVAVATTNPGDVDTWPYRRWIEGGGRAGCVRCDVPATDRLTPDEVAALREAFRDSPDLERRLALGEWSSLKLGESVGEGYDPAVHVATSTLLPSADHVLGIGWDGGHSPSAVIGQFIGGQVQVYASLNDMKIGVLELIEQQVIPWLMEWAPWVLGPGASGALTHVIDPSMKTPGQTTIRESAERTIRETLHGLIKPGAVAWQPRREAVLRVLAPRHEGGRVPLLISPAPETRLLRQALAGRWHYPRTPDGRVDRSRPRKPNSPWADVGDAFAYLCGWLKPGAHVGRDPKQPPQRYAITGRIDPWTGRPKMPAGEESRG